MVAEQGESVGPQQPVKPRTFTRGTVVRNRSRPWRVDRQEVDLNPTTAIDGGDVEQAKFYVLFEGIRPGRLEPPSAGAVGHIQAQDLLLRAYRFGLLHGTVPLISLQCSHVVPGDYQLVPVVIALEINDGHNALRGRQPNHELCSPMLAIRDSRQGDSGRDEHPVQFPDSRRVLRCTQGVSGS